jgi:protein associated with RNAse G/E
MVYTKFDGSLHWNLTLRRLGQDEHGVWLGLPREATMRKGHGPELPIPQAHVILVPRDAWWTATFNGEPERKEIYCDIASPATWTHPGEVTMIDLDLDVVRLRVDGSVVLLDEDEFDEHQVTYGYPPDVIEAAEGAAKWLLSAISAGQEPFATVYRQWLALVDA